MLTLFDAQDNVHPNTLPLPSILFVSNSCVSFRLDFFSTSRSRMGSLSARPYTVATHKPQNSSLKPQLDLHDHGISVETAAPCSIPRVPPRPPATPRPMDPKAQDL